MENQGERDNGPGVGALLRASRLRCGEDLRTVAHVLRIRLSYLEAIEDGRFRDLPGSTYAIGFVRAYSEHLGLDSEEVIRRFKTETSEISGATPSLRFPVPVPERGIPGGAVLFVGVVVAGLAYGGWYASTTKDSFLAELIMPLPERLAALLPEKGEPSAGDTASSDKKTAAESSPASATAATTEADRPAGAETGKVPPAPAAADQPATEPASVAATTGQPAILTPPQPSAASSEATSESQPAETAATSAEPQAPTPAARDRAPERVAEQATSAPPPPHQGSTEAPPAPAAENVAPAQGRADAAIGEAGRTATETAKTMETPPATASAPESNAAGAAATASLSPQRSASTAVGAPAAKQGRTDTDEGRASGASTPAASGQTATTQVSPPSAPAAEDRRVAVLPGAAGDGGVISSETSREGQVFGAQDEISRILVRAKSNSWIQVRDDNGNQLLLTRLLRAGDSYRVPDRPGLTLLTGNAGALEILVDGETVPSIGPLGAVRRGVLLDINRLREGTAVAN